MFNSAICRNARIFIFLGGGALALAEDAKMIRYFSSEGIPSAEIRNNVLKGIMAEYPKAVKLFEIHDSSNTIILLKLSDHSYATKIFGSRSFGYGLMVFDADGSRLLPTKAVGRAEGSFQYLPSDPKDGVVTHAWTLDEKTLELKDAPKLLFRFTFDSKFGAGSGAGATGKKMTLAVDWQAGRVEGIKEVPLPGKEKGLEP